MRLTASWGESLRRLCLAQPYVTGFEIRSDWLGVTHDLDEYRSRPNNYFTNPLLRAVLQAADVPIEAGWNDPWLVAPEGAVEGEGPPVVSRTARYQARYSWDREVAYIRERYGEPIFLGHPEEHAAFQDRFGVQIEHVPTEDLWGVAWHIARAPVVACNQSSPLVIAQGLGREIRLERAPRHLCSAVTGRANEKLLNPA